ncbi:MAG: hypothetical protein AB8G18_07475 [Gammaproteobacteria bacterium]
MNINFKALSAGCGVVAVAAAVLILPQGGSAATAQPASVSQGMVVFIDQETGELRAPTREEASRLQPAVQPNESKLTVQRRADGSESIMLDESYTIYSTVERNADGGWTRTCSMNHDHAQHAQKAVK